MRNLANGNIVVHRNGYMEGSGVVVTANYPLAEVLWEGRPLPITHYQSDLGLVGIPEPVVEDDINHPAHYTAYKGIEVIQLTEQLNFCRGNAVKYIARAGLKSKETEIQDLEKAAWYINREIARIKEETK